VKIDKALKRDKKRHKQITGMQLDNKSIFVIHETIIKKSKIRRKK